MKIQPMKIAVIGGGSWGTTLARLLVNKGHVVTLWVYEVALAETIRTGHENCLYLPGVPLPQSLRIETEIEAAIEGVTCILMAAPSHATRTLLEKMRRSLVPDLPIISATKGIERHTLMLMSDLIQEMLGRETTDRIFVLSGPSFAKEVVMEQPTAVSLAATDVAWGTAIVEGFSTSYFTLFQTTDLIGVQVAGALKNVIALACGCVNGLGLGQNARALLMIRGMEEMAALGVAMGGNRDTFYGLSGLGDLFLTCSEGPSRNLHVGKALGMGRSLQEILKTTQSVSEGVYAAESAYALSKKYKIQMPIVTEIVQILFEGKPCKDGMMAILNKGRPS